MVFSSVGIFQVIQDNLIGILGGGFSLTLIVKVIADAVSNRKATRSIDNFGNLLGNNGKAILKIVNDFKDDIKKEIVAIIDDNKSLVKELKQERKEKEFLQEAFVTVLSVANVPIAQKKEYYNAVLKVSSISEVAKTSLLASIEAEEQKIVSSNVEIDEALNSLQSGDSEQEGV